MTTLKAVLVAGAFVLLSTAWMAGAADECVDCHTRNNGRLAALTDFYLPGRDRNVLLDKAGVTTIILALIGVVIHGILRRILQRKCFFQDENK